MPVISCLSCAKEFDLYTFTYWNYKGEVKCRHCEAFMLIELINGQLKDSPTLIDKKVINIPDVPENINDDLREAQVCFNVSAYKACVVMCRRAIEQICDDKDAQGKSLFDKIEFLLKQNIISQDIYSIFTQIRRFGNYGAHPQDDLLNGIDQYESSKIVEISMHLARHIYHISATIKRL